MSVVKKRSVSIRGHQTSYSLEQPFFDIIVEMAKARSLSLASTIAAIDETRPRDTNLSSALRLAALEWVKRASK